MAWQSLDEVVEHVRWFPSTLRAWQVPATLDVMLRGLELAHYAELASLPDGPAVMRSARQAQDAEGIVVQWGSEFGKPGRAPATFEANQIRRVSRALGLAYRYAGIDYCLGLAREGFVGLEARGNVARFPIVGNPVYQVLDRQLQAARSPGIVPLLTEEHWTTDTLRSWIDRVISDGEPEMTDKEFSAARKHGEMMRAAQTREFPGDLDLGGISLHDAHALWDVLAGLCSVAALLTAKGKDWFTSLLSPSRVALTQRLRDATGLSEETVDAFLFLVTYRHEVHPDPAMAPLVEDADGFLIPLTLVLNSNFERNVLRAVALDPALQGPIGDVRGRMGTAQVAKLLQTLPGCFVATELDVVRRGGEIVSDLDVVAYEPATDTGLILEVKWPAPPDHIIEILRIERQTLEAQDRAERTRGDLLAGRAWVRNWPENLPPPHADSWTWGVISADHLPYSETAYEHLVRPMNWALLWRAVGGTLEASIERVTSPALPVEGRDFVRRWSRAKVGELTIQHEAIELTSGAGFQTEAAAETVAEYRRGRRRRSRP